MPILDGLVDEVVFRNEENGWTVLTVKPEKGKAFTVVGVLPFLEAGECARFEGEWTEHRDYGKQLKCSDYECIDPATKSAVERYLASGVVKGVGPATAKLLVKEFGVRTLDVMENEPWRLMEVEGIGEKRAQQISESFAEQRSSRKAMVFLTGLGFTPAIAMRVFKRYGANTAEIVRANPYRLADEISGVGFQTVDRIALSMGVRLNDDQRLQCGLKYVLDEAVNGGGHTYLPRDVLLRDAGRLLNVEAALIERALAIQTLKGDVICEEAGGTDAVYLRGLYEAESDVAARLLRLQGSGDDADEEISDDAIAGFEREKGMRLSDRQKDAIRIAASRRVTVITGGPGTGKTTLINSLLHLAAPKGKIELCAPTGRAAKRMSETTGAEALTIHRLLEYSGDEEKFKKCEDDPLDAKTIIVDEMSMVDIFLMRALLRAVRAGTRLVLVGDKDQLPSVGAGNVLGDLIDSGVLPVVRLTEVFRQAEASAIVVNAHRINRGEMPIVNRKGTDFFLERMQTAEQAAQSTLNLVKTRLPGYFGLDVLRGIQVMTPMKKGAAGVYEMNRRLQEALNPSEGQPQLTRGETIFRLGDKVMQVKNDYELGWLRGDEEGKGVFNGDIGFITDVNREDKTLTVRFDDGRSAEYFEDVLEELELAYCMSVHKSQGSEFDAVVLPLVSGPPMLMTRNLLYTAVTRAKKLVVITGREDCVRAMVNNNHIARRYSALAERLKAMGGAR